MHFPRLKQIVSEGPPEGPSTNLNGCHQALFFLHLHARGEVKVLFPLPL